MKAYLIIYNLFLILDSEWIDKCIDYTTSLGIF